MLRAVLLFWIVNAESLYAQTCGQVTASDITTTPARCPGAGLITAPSIPSATYRLTGGSIDGELNQSSSQFGSLQAGTYTLTILCPGEPAVTINGIVVANAHSPLGLTVNGSATCPTNGTISATPSGGYNQGGAGAVYEFAYWSSSVAGASRPDGDVTYDNVSSWSNLASGSYFVRVRDICGNFFTQPVEIISTKPVGRVSLGNPTINCSGGSYSYSFPNAQLQNTSGAPITNFAPGAEGYYTYRLERVAATGPCASVAVQEVVVPNTDITSTSTLSSAAFTNIQPGQRYRFVITSPCGNETQATCWTPDQVSILEVKPTFRCEASSNPIRVAFGLYSPSSFYTIRFPVTVEVRFDGNTPPAAPSHTYTAANATQLALLEANYAASAFPITVTSTDGCGIQNTVVKNAPSSTGARPLTFSYRFSCVQDNGNVNVYTYLEGNWYGLEYHSGPIETRTKYELINTATNQVVSTLYGLSNISLNELVFLSVPANATYIVRATPPASAPGCPTLDSNPVTIPLAQGLNFTVVPSFERLCNTGSYNITYKVEDNSFGNLLYRLYQGTDNTGTLVSTSSTPTNVPPGTYYYEVIRSASSFDCANPATRSGVLNLEGGQLDPVIEATLAVNCQQIGGNPQNNGSFYMAFSGFGPFIVERSINGAGFTQVAAAAIDSYTESGLMVGSVYNYRVIDQCGKSVSQQVEIKPLTPRIITNAFEPCEAQPYTFSAVLFGDPLTTYSWEKVGTPGELANTREFTIPNFTAADNGTYKLTVSLLNGCVVRETFITVTLSDDCDTPIASGSLGDRVWFDTNSNGIQDGGEEGVPNVPVTLQGFVGGANPSQADLENPALWTDIEQTFTDSDGEYLFAGLSSGYYRVRFGTVPNYGFTDPLQGTDPALDSDAGEGGYSAAVYINAEGTGIDKDNPTIDAGLVPTGSIGDYVWLDENQNGRQDEDELPVSGVVVNLYVKDTEGNFVFFAETTTDDDGKYLFEGLKEGVYQVEFVLPPGGYVFTYANQSGVPGDQDSDANPTTGRTGEIVIDPSQDVSSILRNNMTIDAGIVFGQLPVKLASFDVAPGENNSALLAWSTTEEVNSEVFQIERSFDAQTWSKIGEVKSKGNSVNLERYRYSDNEWTLGLHYYRLKMVDRDGSYEYSPVKSLRNDFSSAKVTLYPNPVTTELTVKAGERSIIRKVDLHDLNGKLTATRSSTGTVLSMNVSALPAGIYLLKISFDDGSVESRKVLIVR